MPHHRDPTPEEEIQELLISLSSENDLFGAGAAARIEFLASVVERDKLSQLELTVGRIVLDGFGEHTPYAEALNRAVVECGVETAYAALLERAHKRLSTEP